MTENEDVDLEKRGVRLRDERERENGRWPVSILVVVVENKVVSKVAGDVNTGLGMATGAHEC
ncbi:hypothetical protein A2U01_0031617, partial [Trifolium medium]|nr:hypothetical protein [Trifolium medium]